MMTHSFFTHTTYLSLLLVAVLCFCDTSNGQTASPSAGKKPVSSSTRKTTTPTRRPMASKRPTVSPTKSSISYKFQDLKKGSELFRMKTQTSAIIYKGEFENDQEKADFIEYFKTYVFGRWVDDTHSGKYSIISHVKALQRRVAYYERRRQTLQNSLDNNISDKEKKNIEKEIKDIDRYIEQFQTESDSWNYVGFKEEFRKVLDRSRANKEPQNLAMKIANDFAVEVLASSDSSSTKVLKYNCVLLLGELYIRTSSQDRLVYQPAFDFLLKYISDSKTPLYLRIGAMLSIQKFLDKDNYFSLTDKQKENIYNVFLDIIKTKIDPTQYANSKDDPTAAGAIWLRELAIKNLGIMAGNVPSNKQTSNFYPDIASVTELYSILKDTSAPMTTRIVALETLGSFNFHKYPQIKTSQNFLKTVCEFIIEFFQTELDRKVDPLVWGNENETDVRTNVSSEEDPSSLKKDTEQNAIFLRQRIIPVLYAAEVALTGTDSIKDKDWDGLSGMGTKDKMVTEINSVVQDAIKTFNTEITPFMLDSETGTMTYMEKTISDIEDILESFRRILE